MISARDGWGLSAQPNAQVNISIVAGTVSPPVFEQAQYFFTVPEDTQQGASVGAVRAHNPPGMGPSQPQKHVGPMFPFQGSRAPAPLPTVPPAGISPIASGLPSPMVPPAGSSPHSCDLPFPMAPPAGSSLPQPVPCPPPWRLLMESPPTTSGLPSPMAPLAGAGWGGERSASLTVLALYSLVLRSL